MPTEKSLNVAHPVKAKQPLIKDAERYKTILCEKWKTTGECPYTWKCQFAHGEGELRRRSRGGRQRAGATNTCIECEPIESGRKAKPQWDQQRNAKGSHQISNDDASLSEPESNDGQSENTTDRAGHEELKVLARGSSVPLDAVASGAAPVATDAGAFDMSSVRPVGADVPPVPAQLPHIMDFKPTIRLQTAQRSFKLLPLALNRETGKVETRETSFLTPAREASFSTMLVRRQMSNLLDELSKEASMKVIEVL